MMLLGSEMGAWGRIYRFNATLNQWEVDMDRTKLAYLGGNCVSKVDNFGETVDKVWKAVDKL
jgi:hypothetical protein